MLLQSNVGPPGINKISIPFGWIRAKLDNSGERALLVMEMMYKPHLDLEGRSNCRIVCGGKFIKTKLKVRWPVSSKVLRWQSLIDP